MSQYSRRPPPLLPMVWAYSQMMSGIAGRSAARRTTSAGVGYMNELMSEFDPPTRVLPW